MPIKGLASEADQIQVNPPRSPHIMTTMPPAGYCNDFKDKVKYFGRGCRNRPAHICA